MTIAVGFSNTPEAAAAVGAAISEAALRRTGVSLLDPAENGTVQHPEVLAEFRAEAESAGVALELCPLGPDDDLADALIDVSYEQDAQMVVLGLRRRSPVGKLLLGSLSQRVLLEAGCPVYAVKVRVGPRG